MDCRLTLRPRSSPLHPFPYIAHPQSLCYGSGMESKEQRLARFDEFSKKWSALSVSSRNDGAWRIWSLTQLQEEAYQAGVKATLDLYDIRPDD